MCHWVSDASYQVLTAVAATTTDAAAVSSRPVISARKTCFANVMKPLVSSFITPDVIDRASPVSQKKEKKEKKKALSFIVVTLATAIKAFRI